MQESPEDSEKQRQMQAPNRAEVWSRSQASRETAMSGPRFEQTMMQFQVRGLFLWGKRGERRWLRSWYLRNWHVCEGRGSIMMDRMSEEAVF